MKKLIIAILFFGCVIENVFAVDCARPIKKIFTGYSASTSKIHIEYSDGYAGALVRLQFVGNDEKAVDRILSVLMAGHLSGKVIHSRYETGVDGSAPSCTPATTQALSAVWIE